MPMYSAIRRLQLVITGIAYNPPSEFSIRKLSRHREQRNEEETRRGLYVGAVDEERHIEDGCRDGQAEYCGLAGPADEDAPETVHVSQTAVFRVNSSMRGSRV